MGYFKGATQSNISGAHLTPHRKQVKMEGIKITLSTHRGPSFLPRVFDAYPCNNPQDIVIFQMGNRDLERRER